MYLKILIGPNAGQCFLFSPEASRAMLADGRAVKAYPDEGIPNPQPAAFESGPIAAADAVPTPPPGKQAGHGAGAKRQGSVR